MRRNQRVRAISLGLFLASALVLAACGPLPARVDTAELEAVVGVRHGMEINLADVPPTGVPVLCHGQAPAGVASIELYVNGGFVGRSNNTAAPGTREFSYFTAEFSFEPDGPGPHDLRCRTTDHEGRTANSVDVTIFLIGEITTATPTETGVPTATPTSTEVPPTAVPPTAVPPTAVPPTAVPPTAVPPTAVPPTAVPPPIIEYFTATDTTINEGDCPTLSWGVSGYITAVFLKPPEEGVGDHDSRNRCPTTTTTYTLTAHGDPGPPLVTTTATLTIVVIPAPEDTEGPDITDVSESSDDMDWPDPGGCKGCDFPNEVTISAYITDASGVSGAKVNYRVVGGTWQSVGMSQVGTGMYSAIIGPNHLELSLNPPVIARQCATAMMEYYVQAFDVPGNDSQSAVGTVAIHYCYIIG